MADFERSNEGYARALDEYEQHFGDEPPHQYVDGDELISMIEDALESGEPINVNEDLDVPEGVQV